MREGVASFAGVGLTLTRDGGASFHLPSESREGDAQRVRFFRWAGDAIRTYRDSQDEAPGRERETLMAKSVFLGCSLGEKASMPGLARPFEVRRFSLEKPGFALEPPELVRSGAASISAAPGGAVKPVRALSCSSLGRSPAPPVFDADRAWTGLKGEPVLPGKKRSSNQLGNLLYAIEGPEDAKGTPATLTLRWQDLGDPSSKPRAWTGPVPKGVPAENPVLRGTAFAGSEVLFAVFDGRMPSKAAVVRAKEGGAAEAVEAPGGVGSSIVVGAGEEAPVAWLNNDASMQIRAGNDGGDDATDEVRAHGAAVGALAKATEAGGFCDALAKRDRDRRPAHSSGAN